jgi:CRP-like cAMP-binding protein
MKEYSDGDGRAFPRKSERDDLTPAERVLLTAFAVRRRRFEAGTELISGDRPLDFAYVVHEGWACTFREISDGTRQTVDFRLPGDFLGFIGLTARIHSDSVVALTDVTVSEVGIDKLLTTFRQSPLLAEGVLRSLSRDAAIISEHLVNLGSRGAMQRTVHLLIEIGYRLNSVGLAEPTSYQCPLTQKDIAEALGITHVHLNRVLRQLRSQGLLSFNDHTVTLHDMRSLVRIAEFNPAYLNYR